MMKTTAAAIRAQYTDLYTLLSYVSTMPMTKEEAKDATCTDTVIGNDTQFTLEGNSWNSAVNPQKKEEPSSRMNRASSNVFVKNTNGSYLFASATNMVHANSRKIKWPNTSCDESVVYPMCYFGE